jgi:cysteine-rich repeat protein
MRTFQYSLLCLSLSAFAACGDSSDGPADGGMDAHVAVCGDSHLDPGESCDDGNTNDGDACSSACRRAAFCGDGNRNGDEVCDDGNNSSGDGCSADCTSDESCGNSVRDIGKGELCDDGNTSMGDGCSADCLDQERCANDTVDPGENCDDGNITRWDGCGGDCIVEQTFIFRSIQISEEALGCDFSGDGAPDNAFARGVGAARGLLNAQLETAVSDGTLLFGVNMMAVTDTSLTDASEMSVAWIEYVDRDMDANNNFDGNGQVYVSRSSITGEGSPLVALAGAINNHHVLAGPQDIILPLPIGITINLDVRRAHFAADIADHGSDPRTLDNSSLCGVVPTRSLADIPDLISLVAGAAPAACDGGDPGNLADMLIAGAVALGIQIGPEQPDVDLDGDGLERFDVLTTGPSGCQPVIAGCYDGDGTHIDGRSCVFDSRMADGFSANLLLDGIDVDVRGAQ